MYRCPLIVEAILKDADQPLWILVGQGMQKDAIDQTKDGSIGSDADRQREDCRDREAGPPNKASDRVPAVGYEIFEPGQATLVAQRLHRLCDSSNLDPGRAQSTLGRVATAPRVL